MSKIHVQLRTNSIDFGELNIATFERSNEEVDFINKHKLIKFESKFFNVESVAIYGQTAIIFVTNQCGDLATINNYVKDFDASFKKLKKT